jgi:hypothetical protein
MIRRRFFFGNICACDLAFGLSHGRIAISFVAGTLNSAAAFSIAAASSGGLNLPPYFRYPATIETMLNIGLIGSSS